MEEHEQIKKEPGYYWAHFVFKDVDLWEPVKIDDDGRICVFGTEWKDTLEYWGITEFGEKLEHSSKEKSNV